MKQDQFFKENWDCSTEDAIRQGDEEFGFSAPKALFPEVGTSDLSMCRFLMGHEDLQLRPPHNVTVRAEKIITEFILERAGPVICKTFLLEFKAFRPIPVICPARRASPETYWKR